MQELLFYAIVANYSVSVTPKTYSYNYCRL